MMLDTLRAGIIATIKASPTVVSIYRRAAVDDGFGGTTTVAGRGSFVGKARVRIYHASGSVQGNAENPAGLSASLSLYALTDYHAPLAEGDAITDDSSWWAVGPVNELKDGTRVFATEAPLSIVERSDMEALVYAGDIVTDGNVAVYDDGGQA